MLPVKDKVADWLLHYADIMELNYWAKTECRSAEWNEGAGTWEGEPRNMWKPTNVQNLWIHGGNMHRSRHDSKYLALQLKARMEGLPTLVFELEESHHSR